MLQINSKDTVLDKNTEDQRTMQIVREEDLCVDQWYSCIYKAAGPFAKQRPKNKENVRKHRYFEWYFLHLLCVNDQRNCNRQIYFEREWPSPVFSAA